MAEHVHKSTASSLEAGYYWVNSDGNWEIMHCAGQGWWRIGSDEELETKDIGEIGPLIYSTEIKMKGDGVSAIAAERERQIDEEGWSPEHDDKYLHGALSDAAACYALWAGNSLRTLPKTPRHSSFLWTLWPFKREWWKSTSRRRDLIKAGALIAAEIDRLDRAAKKGGA